MTQRIASLVCVLLLATPVAVRAGLSGDFKPPNILIIMADDNPWSGYGFMAKLEEEGGETTACLYGRSASGTCTPKKQKDLFTKPESDAGCKTQVYPGDPNTDSWDNDSCPWTPGIDKLAHEGIVYPIGHAGSSVCMPSFQTTLTGRLGKDWRTPPLGPVHGGRFRLHPNPDSGDPPDYYLPGLLNHALAAAFEGEEAPQYRSIGFSKIWNEPKTAKGYTDEVGFTCGLRDRKLARYTIDPIIQFIRGEGGEDGDSGSYPQEGKESGDSINGLDDWNGVHCRDTTWQTTDDPWLVFYAPSLPHKKFDAYKITKHRSGVTSATVLSECNNLINNADCLRIPQGDNSGTWLGSRLEQRFDLMDTLLDKDLDLKVRGGDTMFIANLILLDYWIDELVRFLITEDDDRYPSGETKMIETTLIIYQSDNGYKLPNSKSGKRENGFRTPIIVREPGAWNNTDAVSDHTLKPNLELVSALDIIPTAVSIATNGTVKYRECSDFLDVPGRPGFEPPPETGDNHPGCLHGADITDGSFARSMLYGERRNNNEVLTGAYVRLVRSPSELVNLDQFPDNIYCTPVGAVGETEGSCHIRIEQSKKCKLKAYDLAADPDERYDLMKMKTPSYDWSGTQGYWEGQFNDVFPKDRQCYRYIPTPVETPSAHNGT